VYKKALDEIKLKKIEEAKQAPKVLPKKLGSTSQITLFQSQVCFNVFIFKALKFKG